MKPIMTNETHRKDEYELLQACLLPMHSLNVHLLKRVTQPSVCSTTYIAECEKRVGDND
jgi:hypothetical protein